MQHPRSTKPSRMFPVAIIGSSFLLAFQPGHAGITWPGMNDDPPVTQPQPGDTVTCTGVCPAWADDTPEQTLLVTAGATIPQVDLSGPTSTIENHGTLSDGASLLGPSGTFLNYGTANDILLAGVDYEARNHGTITADQSGLELVPGGAMSSSQQEEGGGLMVNAASLDGTGEITTTGDYFAGMLVRDPKAIINLRNNARISGGGSLMAKAQITTNGDGSPGIHLVDDGEPGEDGGSLDNTIENNGNIETHGAESPGIRHAQLFDSVPPGSGVTWIENLEFGSIITYWTESPGIQTHGYEVAVSNHGSILTLQWDSAGIDLWGTNGVAVTNEHLGTIWTQGSIYSPGIMLAGTKRSTHANVTNAGEIYTEGVDSPGIVVLGPGHSVENGNGSQPDRPRIETSGPGSAGIMLGLVHSTLGINQPSNNGTASNEGTISTEGTSAPGISVTGSDNTVFNFLGGTISTDGDSSPGIELSGSSEVDNVSDISTEGNHSSGISGNGLEIEVRHASGNITTLGDHAHGIDIGTVTARVLSVSSPSIVTGGESAHGISVSSNEVTLHGDGVIRTTGVDACGIHVSAANGKVHNNGLLQTTAAGATGIHAEAETTLAGDLLEITNNSTIITGAANADGVHASNGSLAITNHGSISTSGANSDGVELGGQSTSGGAKENRLQNAGTIAVSGAGSVGVRLATGSGQQAKFVNWIGGQVTSAGVAVAGSDGIDRVTNWSSLTGNVRLGANDDVFTRYRGSGVTGTVDGGSQASGLPGTGDQLKLLFEGAETLAGGQFINFELLRAAGIGSLTLIEDLAVSESTFAEGDVHVAEGVALESDVTIEPGATLGGSGSVNGDVVDNGGSVSPGESTGILSVEGDFTLNDGTLVLEADAAADRDILSVRGDVSLSGGVLHVFLGYVPGGGEVLQFFDVDGSFTVGPGFGGVLGFAQPASGVPAGTPFTVDLGGTLVAGVVSGFVGDPQADADHDGADALMEYAQGGSDDDGELVDATTLTIAGDNVEFVVSRNPAAGDVDFVFEVSADLEVWREAEFIGWDSPNRALYSFPADGRSRLFGRVRVALRP